MSNAPTKCEQVALGIGPLKMVVELPGPLPPELRERYQPFSLDMPSAANLRVDVSYDPDLFEGSFFPVSTEWTESEFTASSYNFRVRYAAGHASVEATPDWRAVDASLRILTSALLLEKGAILLHASAVIRDSWAYVFSGPSESGKSTMASMAGTGQAGSDELVCVQPQGRRLQVYDTPFWNTRPLADFGRADGKGLFFLRQYPSTFVRSLSTKKALLEIWKNAFFDPEDSYQSRLALGVCAALAKTSPYYLYFRKNEEEVWRCLESV